MRPDALQQAVTKMEQRGVDGRAIAVFEDYWRQLADGAHGYIAESDISPLTEVPELRQVDVDDDQRAEALRRVAVIKLNGGLGTSMGMSGPKSALVASIMLCLVMSAIGGRPAMVTAAAGSIALVVGPMVQVHGPGYILPAVLLAGGLDPDNVADAIATARPIPESPPVMRARLPASRSRPT